ncbi:MAG TPA: cupin domain-containing protein [Caulobacteraceae bacterium]|nr:cupin domain-containing protein [Caulobacteraceae bacterium]
MRAVLLAGAVAALVSFGAARAQAPEDAKFASAADVAAVIAKAKAAAKPGAANTIESIFAVSPYATSLEFHQGMGQASVHENQAELIIVAEGKGVANLGGQLVDPKRTNAHNLTAKTISGATSRPVAKGDMWFVPQGVPHQLNAAEGGISVITLHVQRPVPAEAP